MFLGRQNYYGNEIGDWVLCRLSMRKKSLESEYGSTSTHHAPSKLMFDFMMVSNKTCSSTSSSCSSSSINNIEVSSNAPDHQQDYTHF